MNIFNHIKQLKVQGKKIGITFSAFDVLHAGHIAMLSEAKNHCDYLICGLQTDPTIDRPDTKNKPVQTIVERQIQLAACRYVDEVVVYQTEQDLVDLLLILPIDVRILGVEYQDKDFTGREECYNRNIEAFNLHPDLKLADLKVLSLGAGNVEKHSISSFRKIWLFQAYYNQCYFQLLLPHPAHGCKCPSSMRRHRSARAAYFSLWVTIIKEVRRSLLSFAISS